MVLKAQRKEEITEVIKKIKIFRFKDGSAAVLL